MGPSADVTLGSSSLSPRPSLPLIAENGKRLVQQHCSPCHIVEPNQRQELANSPSFETIARKHGNAPEQIAFAILAPHPRMNVSPLSP